MTKRPKPLLEDEDQSIEDLIKYLDRLGVPRLAEDVSEERFARRVLESQILLNSIEGVREFESQFQDQIEQRFLNIYSQMFDKAATYNNAILAIAYAGFFAIWNFISFSLSLQDTQIIATLLGISLICFVWWTLKVAIFNVNVTKNVAAVYGLVGLSRDEKVQKLLDAEAENNLAEMRIHVQWKYWFYLSTVSGFSAGFLLIATVFFGVVGIDFSAYRIFKTLLDFSFPPETRPF